jgi:MFS family permease
MLLTNNRNFRLLFSATAISNLGDGISLLAFPWIATLITRDPVMIGLVAAAGRLPWLLFAIPAGVITDRADRRRLMVQADIFRLLLTLGIVGLILSGPALPMSEHDPLARNLVLALSLGAFLLGVAEVLRDNAAQTFLPNIVKADDLERANGQLWSVEQITGQFIGPPLAGFLIAMAIPAPFLVDAATFAIAAVCVWAIQSTARSKPRIRAGFLEEMREGITWLINHRLILSFAILLGFMNMIGTAEMTILVIYSQEILNLSAASYGILLTAAAGGVVGGLQCPRIIKRIGSANAIATALALFPIAPFLIWWTSSPIVVAIALFTQMFAALQWNIVTVSLRQRVIPDELLGRVNSLYRFLGWGMMPIGALLGGLTVSLAEPELGRIAAVRMPYLLSGATSVALLILGVFVLRLPKQLRP